MDGMTDQTNPNSLFFSTFIGNTVFITSNVVQTNRIGISQELMTETVPLYFEGVLMDVDDDYFYLGDGKNVSNAIKREFVLQIELKEEKDKYLEMLESINPHDENDFN